VGRLTSHLEVRARVRRDNRVSNSLVKEDKGLRTLLNETETPNQRLPTLPTNLHSKVLLEEEEAEVAEVTVTMTHRLTGTEVGTTIPIRPEGRTTARTIDQILWN